VPQLIGRTAHGHAIAEEIQRDFVVLRLKQCIDERWKRVAICELKHVLAAYRGDIGTSYINPTLLGVN
jgi:hypothetical protein